MKPWFRVLRWSAIAALLLTLTLLLLALQTAPALPARGAISPEEVALAKDFLRRSDPRQKPPGSLNTLQVEPRELEVLLSYLASRALPGLVARLQLRDHGAELRASAPLPAGLWLNVQARLVERGRLPAITELRIGRLALPDPLAEVLRRYVLMRLSGTDEVRLATDMVRHVGLQPDRLELVYVWRADSLARVMDSLLPAQEQARLQVYWAKLYELAARPRQGLSVPLVELLPPMFELARQRSALGEAVAENRACLLAMALYASGRQPAQLVPSLRDWPQPRPLMVSLHGRPDFPQHLLVSAVLAIEGGGPLSDAIGVYKEVADTQGGSGFSFNDIAADRAGTRLGLLALERAGRLQQRLAAGVSEMQLLPDVSDLPEYLSEQVFRERYGSTSSKAYAEVMKSIEARLERAPLLP